GGAVRVGESGPRSAPPPRAPLAAPGLAPRLGGGGGLAPAGGRVGGRGRVGRQVGRRGVEAEPGERFREMVRRVGEDVDRAAVGVVDPDPPRVEVQLAADRAGQERLLPAIFAVADDRMADGEHVDAKLVGAPGQRLEQDEGGAVAGAVDHAVAGARAHSRFLIDMRLLAARARLLGERQVDLSLLDRRHADDDRPVELARGAAGEGAREEGRRARRAGDEERARRVLVEPVDQLRARLAWLDQPVEQPVEMVPRLRPALRREAGRLVEHEGGGIGVDHERSHEGDLVVAQGLAPAPRRTRARRLPGERRYADDLPGLDPLAGRGAPAVEAELPGARPARDLAEARLGHVAPEPAVEPDAVVLGIDGELADVAPAHPAVRMIASPAKSNATAPITEARI